MPSAPSSRVARTIAGSVASCSATAGGSSCTSPCVRMGMAGRRGNNEGTVYQRSDGRWCGAVSDGTGRRKFVYAASRQEAARKLTQALHDHLRGLPVADDRITTGALLDKWIEHVASLAVRPLTLERYKTIVAL